MKENKILLCYSSGVFVLVGGYTDTVFPTVLDPSSPDWQTSLHGQMMLRYVSKILNAVFDFRCPHVTHGF
jgi:hypothetical protein